MREETLTALKGTRLRRSELAAAWLAEAQGASGIGDLAGLMHVLREKLIVCEGLEVSEALAVLEKLVDWLGASPDEFTHGTITPSLDAGVEVLTLYADTTPIIEWPGLARVADRWTFAFGKDHVFLPAPGLD